MILIKTSSVVFFIVSSVAALGSTTNNVVDTHSVGLTSNFSPRMDFEQWKPLTGRGDPLRNDPTYDYEPPILERVHYWADDTRLEREHYPERKSEILMLGVSSRKPSIAPTHPPLHSRRPPIRSTTPNYEHFGYKFSDNYPMTILVPPPPPPPGHQPPLFILTENTLPHVDSEVIYSKPKLVPKNSTTIPESVTSQYAFQESNLIYQSSTTQNWIVESNKTLPPSNTVSNDYAGWGPTTPIDENNTNDTQNLIQTEHLEVVKLPYTFYKPMLSESPPPVEGVSTKVTIPAFLPTVLPPTEAEIPSTKISWPTEHATYETTPSYDFSQENTRDNRTSIMQTTPPIDDIQTMPGITLLDMLGPMMSMPMVNGPERPEDNLYAHATENMQVYETHDKENNINLETMQTLQPPPPTANLETKEKEFHHLLNNKQHFRRPSVHTHDPYLHMRFTAPISTIASSVDTNEKQKSTTETPTTPMYLIIQGHSKVKTYSSKLNPANELKIDNPKPNETTEVKHLHPYKDKSFKKNSEDTTKKNRSKNLRSLVDTGVGSIEIQEADVGIRYDISDGSDVPVEIYKKGIVANDEKTYKGISPFSNEIRPRRQLDLDSIFPGDEDSLEDLIDNYFDITSNSKKNVSTKESVSKTNPEIDDLQNSSDTEYTVEES